MHEAKHTPGPWLALELFAGDWSVFNHYEPMRLVADVGTYSAAEHNARLIAAAPDMSAALEACLNVLTACVRPRDEADDAEFINEAKRGALAALQKARGENDD